MFAASFFAALALGAGSASAQVGIWGQCGGIGFTGPTSCIEGSTCVVQNPYYSQCLSGSGVTTTSSPTTSTTRPSSSSTHTASPAAPPTATFANPVIWEDLADVDILRVNDTYYYSASTMHFSPGAPILRSYDLVNWEFIGHSVPSLDFGDPAYSLIGGRAYIRGVWASSLKFRESTSTWYWIGCIDFWHTFVYTAPDVTGPWAQASTINNCYYDVGLLIDDDDTMYVAYGGTNVSVAQLSPDGLSQVRTQSIYNSTVGAIEGSRFYKRDGAYYIFNDLPSTAEYVMKSTSGPFGPYESRPFIENVQSPISGGNPHQGGLVDTPEGDWYYMAFTDAYPGGRVPILAPLSWTEDGWPTMSLPDNAWPKSEVYPLTSHPMPSLAVFDDFSSSTLGPQWEWNHNPDNTKWSLNNDDGGGLILQTATVTTDLYSAQNTLTHRILGPKSNGTIRVDITNMVDGDLMGLSMFRDVSAFIAVRHSGGMMRSIEMVNGLTLNSTDSWSTISDGSVVAFAGFQGDEVWLRATADIANGGKQVTTFSWSTDGEVFEELGVALAENPDWRFFMGYRFGIFNFATGALGGSAVVKSFEMVPAQ